MRSMPHPLFCSMVCVLASLVVGLPAVALVYVRRGTASTQSGASHPHAVRVLKCTDEDGAATFKLPRGVATADIDWQSCRRPTSRHGAVG